MKIIKAAFKFKRYDSSIDVGHNSTLSVRMREIDMKEKRAMAEICNFILVSR